MSDSCCYSSFLWLQIFQPTWWDQSLLPQKLWNFGSFQDLNNAPKTKKLCLLCREDVAFKCHCKQVSVHKRTKSRETNVNSNLLLKIPTLHFPDESSFACVFHLEAISANSPWPQDGSHFLRQRWFSAAAVSDNVHPLQILLRHPPQLLTKHFNSLPLVAMVIDPQEQQGDVSKSAQRQVNKVSMATEEPEETETEDWQQHGWVWLCTKVRRIKSWNFWGTPGSS